MRQGIGFQPCPCTKDIMTKVEDLVTAKEGIGLRQDMQTSSQPLLVKVQTDMGVDKKLKHVFSLPYL